MARLFPMLGATGLALTVAAQAFAADIEISNAWSRASAGMARAGGAFLTITNSGATDDRVIAATTPVSRITELHTHIKDGEIMRMRQVDAIEVPAGKTVTLKPGGMHIMFMDLKEPLREGQTFPLTLTLDQAGDRTVTVTVGGPARWPDTGATRPA